MKRNLILTSLLFLNTILIGQGSWLQKNSLPGLGRYAAFVFSINDKGYLGGGQSSSTGFLGDLWEFNPIENTWTQKANYGGGTICSSVVFNINNIAYLCTGYNGQYQNSVWTYNPLTNIWIQKNNFPGTARYGAYGFSIGSKGYMGTGCSISNYLNDFWEYESSSDSWIQSTNFTTSGRFGIAAFTINGKGYAGFGSGANNSVVYNDLFEFDPSNNTWTQKANYPGSARYYPSIFVLNNEAYIGTGSPNINYASNPVFTVDFFKFSTVNNSWTAITTFTGVGRTASSGLTIGNKGYIGFGFSSYPLSSYLNDFWEYTPAGSSINENISMDIAVIKINLHNKSIQLEMKSNFQGSSYKIYNIAGQLLRNEKINNSNQIININQLVKGSYIFQVNSNGKYKSEKFIIL
ncbi:MAG: kelch repeat-containing protein [Bacteroidales bacterium]